MNTTNTNYVIINLHHPSCANQSAAAEAAGRRVFYISAVHPRQILGHLWQEDGYQGAWMENFRVIARIGGVVRIFESPGIISEDPTRIASWVLSQLLAGKKPASIQDALDRSTEKTWALVA